MNKDIWLDLILAIGLVVLLMILGRWSRRATDNGTEGGDDEGDSLGQGYRSLIRQAGMAPEDVYGPLLAMKAVLAFALPAVLVVFVGKAVLGGAWLLWMVGLAILGFFLPEFWLVSIRRKRRRQVRRSLSYFLDLAVALLNAGLSPERAFVRAARDGFSEPNPLADEILQLGQELNLGRDRGQAFTELADRTGVRELRAVAAAVDMGLRVGTPIEETLHAQADLLRIKRREEALRHISASSVMSMVPVFLCGIPVFAVVVYFPAVLEIMDTLRLLSPR